MDDVVNVAKPLASYAPYRRAGDFVFLAGIVAADPDTGRVIAGYEDLPEDVRRQAGMTGEMSVDSKDGPIAAQSWYVMTKLQETLEGLGGHLEDVVSVTQYLCDLRDFPIYNRIRAEFFKAPPASTVVRVLELLPTPASRLEVTATAYLPQS